ncbi:hypothetical protein GCM10007424_22570 [Flavobacterium suaedae]|uniref:Uncharacterized protein n=1 Tax=Flavobacterium suaedae TaxID=1767027 RepID=A0ABQ1JY55_9FLAO|nr:hypothetical protein [Flavobacterium suaedae]GGB82032.1 hypothetical protein GCM10007424_22570 [Flavobacterium suaedae]
MGKNQASSKLIHAIEGNLYLVNSDTDIQADMVLLASEKEYRYGGHNYVVEEFVGSNKYKGIVFNYYHSLISTRVDYGNPDESIHISFMLDNPSSSWKDGDRIRIMLLNEVDEHEFIKMKPYFQEYLREFKDRDNVSSEEFDAFNKKWNDNNQNYRVNYRYNINAIIDKPRLMSVFSISDDFVNVDDIKNKLVPRYTKDGGVLTLKLKS